MIAWEAAFFTHNSPLTKQLPLVFRTYDLSGMSAVTRVDLQEAIYRLKNSLRFRSSIEPDVDFMVRLLARSVLR